MCGIATIFAHGGLETPEAEEQMLARALAAMRHRGPDGERWLTSTDRCCILGQTRLAIMGLDRGQQPLTNETGSVTAVVNGELYDFERLRTELEAKNHRFTTDTDSEIVIHLYEEYGLEMMRHLRGEFAFVLWDAERQRLVAGRDRFGIKPLFWNRSGRRWCFASEVKAIRELGVSLSWRADAIGAALAHQYLRPDQTFFTGIHLLPPAQLLVIENGESRFLRYWQPTWQGGHVTPEEIRHLFEESVRLRLRADVPICCTLSGGLDSSSVALLSARLTGRPVDCFTVSFDGKAYDEAPQVMTDLSTVPEELRLHVVPVSRHDLVNELEGCVEKSEGLAINGQLVGKHLLSRAIHKAGYKVVLAGEGADEAFHGYAHLQADFHRWNGTPVTQAYPLQRGIMLPSAGSKRQGWLRPPWLPMLPTFLEAKMATGALFTDLLTSKVSPQEQLDLTLAMIAPELENANFPQMSGWLWTRLALASYILRVLGDGAEMASSVEARLPFLDHHLFEAACRCPLASLHENGHSKAILRHALKGLMPETMRWRPKHPFISPPLLHANDPVVREFINDVLRSSKLPFFAPQAIARWLDGFLNSSAEQQALADPQLMLLLTMTLLAESHSL